MSLISTSAPFEEAHGTIDNFCNLKKIKTATAAGLYENIVFASTQGLFVGMLMQTGEIQISDRTYFKGLNVTNCEVMEGNLLLCTLNDEKGISKIMTVDVEED